MKIQEIYTPIEDARREIHLRRNNAQLRHKVEQFLGGPPPGSGIEPRAYLWKALHTPNREFYRFVAQAKLAGCQPTALEYRDDHFCSSNLDKLGLLRLTLVTGTNRHGEQIFRRIVIADITGSEGIPLSAIATHWGASLATFHQDLLKGCFPELPLTDNSAWLHARGANPKEFYPAALTRFLCQGILFENFIDKPGEEIFIRDVVLPAFESVCDLFGLRPLIVPLLPECTSDDPSWTWYDSHVAKLLKEILPPPAA